MLNFPNLTLRHLTVLRPKLTSQFSKGLTCLKVVFFALAGLLVHALGFGIASAQGGDDPAMVPAAQAPAAQAPTAADMQRSLELSTGFQNLSAGFGSWRDLTLRGTYGLPSHVLQGEISANRCFNKDGTFIGVSDTYTFNDDWYSNVALGFGDGAFYLPRYRVDVTLYKK